MSVSGVRSPRFFSTSNFGVGCNAYVCPGRVGITQWGGRGLGGAVLGSPHHALLIGGLRDCKPRERDGKIDKRDRFQPTETAGGCQCKINFNSVTEYQFPAILPPPLRRAAVQGHSTCCPDILSGGHDGRGSRFRFRIMPPSQEFLEGGEGGRFP